MTTPHSAFDESFDPQAAAYASANLQTPTADEVRAADSAVLRTATRRRLMLLGAVWLAWAIVCAVLVLTLSFGIIITICSGVTLLVATFVAPVQRPSANGPLVTFGPVGRALRVVVSPMSWGATLARNPPSSGDGA